MKTAAELKHGDVFSLSNREGLWVAVRNSDDADVVKWVAFVSQLGSLATGNVEGQFIDSDNDRMYVVHFNIADLYLKVK